MRQVVALAFLSITLAACGDNNSRPPDAPEGSDGPRPPDARIDAPIDADTGMTSAQIQAVRDAADGPVNLPIAGAVVTYLKPMVGSDPAGFTVQGEMTGPAVFIAVDPATLTPAPVVGDVVSFTVTNMATFGMLRQADAISDFSRTSTANVDGLVQNITGANDVVSALGTYESEIVDVTGTIPAGAMFVSAGTGFQQIQIETAGISGDTNYRIRIPTAVRSAIDMEPTCTGFTVNNVPVGRFNAVAQLGVYFATDITLTGCPAPIVETAAATSATEVVITFSRNIAPTSVMADGSQFTFTGGLTASAATVSGRNVTVTTSAQTGGTNYTVTVANTVTDLQGTGVDTPNTAMFTGFGGGGGSTLVINEVDYDQVGTDATEFIEVFNGGASAVDLTNLAVVLANGSTNAEYARYNLVDAGASLPAGGYLVIKNTAVTVPGGVLTLTAPDNSVQNGGPDGIALVDTAASTVIDALSYEGSMTAVTITGFPGPVSLVEGAATSVVDDGSAVNSMARTPNGTDTDNALADWALSGTPSPGAAN